MDNNWCSLFKEKRTDEFGFVDTAEEADRLINVFFTSTASGFVVYKVDAKNFGNTDFSSKPCKLVWQLDATKFHMDIPYDGTPFMKVNTRILNCQFGVDKCGKKRRMERAEREKDGRVRNTPSIKRNCPANVALVEIIRFPDFTLEEDTANGREYVSQYFYSTVKQGDVKIERRIYVSLPKEIEHKFHPTDEEICLSRKFKRSTNQQMLAALSSTTGRVEDISVETVQHSMKLEENEIVISVYASAVNREDIDKRKKLTSVEDPYIVGCEASGKVLAVRQDSKFSYNDRVMAYLPHGGCAEKVTVHQDHVIPVPEWMTYSLAAAVPQTWLTAYHLLYFDASMKTGDVVLIHAGASGIGMALVQLVNKAGGCAIVTASSQEKIDICLSLGASAGFCYKSLDFKKEIAEYLQGKCVNLILDSVAGTHWQLNSNLIAPNGTWIIYGLLSGPYIAGDMRPLLTKNITIKTSFLRSKSHEYISEMISSFTDKVLPHFEPNSQFELKPIVNKIYELEDISDAHKFVETNQNIGKVIIKIRNENGTVIRNKTKKTKVEQEIVAKPTKVIKKEQNTYHHHLHGGPRIIIVEAAGKFSQKNELKQASSQ